MRRASLVVLAVLVSAVAAVGQADFRIFGGGCDHGGGVASPTWTGRPVPGAVGTVIVAPVPSGQLGALAFGVSNLRDPFGPLPRPIDGFGAPGCLQRTSLDALLPILTGLGRAVHFVPVPNDTGLVGAVLYCQHVHAAPGANRLGVAVSDAARLRIGGAASRLVALSWNVHHGAGLDNRIDLGRIAAAIARTGAGIVALQEVDRNVPRSGSVDQAADLARRLGMNGVFGASIPLSGGEYGNALLTTLPILRHRVHPLPNPAGREARTVLDAELRLADGRVIRAMSTHLDHGADPTTRRQSVEAIVRLVEASTLPVILLGDLNAEAGSAEIRLLADVMDDVARIRPEPTFPADRPAKRIDYAFTWPRLPFATIDASVPIEPVASDHRPVRTVVDLY